MRFVRAGWTCRAKTVVDGVEAPAEVAVSGRMWA